MSREISKLLSLILRHDPGKYGITLDANGWTPINPLIAKVRGAGNPGFDRAALDAVVENNDKKRFTISEDGLRIRAAQGHSVAVDLGIAPSRPPATLFHGTAISNLDSIMSQGLLPGKRQQVHLSLERETATKVGSRHGKPIVLTVASERMFENGIQFFQAENGVWLTDRVAPEYLKFDDLKDS